MRRLLASPLVASALALAVAQLSPPIARADETLDPDTDAARLRFRRGSALYAAGDYEGALRELRAAHDIKPLPALDYNIARCLDRLDRPEEAVAAYQRWIAAASSKDPDAVEARVRVRVLQARIEARRTSASPPAPVAAAPTETAPPATGEAAPPRRHFGVVLPLVVGGAAVIGLGVGAGLYGSAAADWSRLSTSCAPRCGASEVSSAQTREVQGVALLVGGAVVAAVDVVLWVVYARQPSRDASRTRAASLVPSLDGRSVGLTLRGGF